MSETKPRSFRRLKRILVIIGVIIVLLFVVGFIYVRQDKFGSNPSGARLAIVQKSPHFKDGQFVNFSNTPEIAEGYSTIGVMYEFIFKGSPRKRPIDILPSIKNDLHAIPLKEDVLVWFGHSSYYIQIDGKRFLMDPVFSGNASPIPGTNTSFAGTDVYSVDDLPDIDYLIISHDHYDHTDFETLTKLRPKIKYVICGLGVGAHFDKWGYSKDAIIEKDWDERIDIDSGFTIHTAPARHFSGRGLTANNTLWMSYLIQTPTMKFYVGGDSGYDKHFAAIGEKFGPIDLAMIDNGQYDSSWRYVHTLPEEVMMAARDLRTKRLFPVHSSKFAMANHAWDEPLSRITELNKSVNLPLVTPIIGEIVFLKDEEQQFKEWWVGLH